MQWTRTRSTLNVNDVKHSCFIHLVLEHGPSEGPDGGKDKVVLIHLLGRVWWGVLGSEQGFQQVAQSLDHADVSDRGHLS